MTLTLSLCPHSCPKWRDRRKGKSPGRGPQRVKRLKGGAVAIRASQPHVCDLIRRFVQCHETFEAVSLNNLCNSRNHVAMAAWRVH
eukprot:364937-Chlamydomonas_euryale.AAC.12